MARAELGYLPCPDCGKGTCHVHLDKRQRAFYYCDRCTSQHLTRSGEGSDGLIARMTPVADEPSPPTPGADPDEEEEDDMATKKGGNDGDEKGGDRRQSNDRRTSSGERTKGDQERGKKKEKDFHEEVFGVPDNEGGD